MAIKQNVMDVPLHRELKNSYLVYSLSVIVSRALPDVRDGLKPVHRRVMYAMHKSGFVHDKATKKCARIVGEVVGKYHPHGETAVYDSVVRMAQDFSMNIPLIEGQGNFGSVDGDSAAAMRYTEARMNEISSYFFSDIPYGVVDFVPNYDNSEIEPSVLPARFPNILINGVSGIAVGMATSIPPFNITEVMDACIKCVSDETITDEEIISGIQGPDFPTGGILLDNGMLRSAMLTGRGSFIIRGQYSIELRESDKKRIIINSLPYQVNKSVLIQRIAQLTRDKRIDGIIDIRDESNLDGMRIAIDLKKGFAADFVTRQLYSMTSLQNNFSLIMLCICDGIPQVLSVPKIVRKFIDFRRSVITSRTSFQLEETRNRGHVLLGLAISAANINTVVSIIRSSASPSDALNSLLEHKWEVSNELLEIIDLISDSRTVLFDEKYIRLSKEQAQSILDLKLSKLTQIGIDDVREDASTNATKIKFLLKIISSQEEINSIIKEELQEIRSKFAIARRTEIVCDSGLHNDMSLIKKDDVVVTIITSNYIKRTPLSDYRLQKRGGRGRLATLKSNDDAFISHVFVTTTHNYILFFSSLGIVYKVLAHKIFSGQLQSKGKHLLNILPLKKDEIITSVINLPIDINECSNLYIFFVSKYGYVRKNSIEDFLDVNKKGKIAMRLHRDDDCIVSVFLCSNKDTVLLLTKNGIGARFSVQDVRVFSSRSARGVIGIRLRPSDEVVSGLNIIQSNDKSFVFTVTRLGYAKRTNVSKYRILSRACCGVIAHSLSENDELVNGFVAKDGTEIISTTSFGNVIRYPTDSVRISGRDTLGVRIIRMEKDDFTTSTVNIDESFI